MGNADRQKTGSTGFKPFAKVLAREHSRCAIEITSDGGTVRMAMLHPLNQERSKT